MCLLTKLDLVLSGRTFCANEVASAIGDGTLSCSPEKGLQVANVSHPSYAPEIASVVQRQLDILRTEETTPERIAGVEAGLQKLRRDIAIAEELFRGMHAFHGFYS